MCQCVYDVIFEITKSKQTHYKDITFLLQIVCATYGTIAVGYLLYKLRSPKAEKPSSSS